MYQPYALPSASADRVTLVIDDSPSMRKLVRHMLYQVGLRDHVHDASSADCLPLLRRYRPRLIILSWDIEGPGSSNFVTFIRNQPVAGPGKFEGEREAVREAYRSYLDGFADDDGDVLTVTLDAPQETVRIREDEQGFVSEVRS